MNEDFVTYEIAVILRELGFDWQCRAFYKIQNEKARLLNTDNIQGFDYCSNTSLQKYNCDEINIAAPTIQMAKKWLHKTYDILIYVDYNGDIGKYCWATTDTKTGSPIPCDGLADSPEDAELDGLLYCLKHRV